MKDDGIPFSYFLGGKKNSKKSSKRKPRNNRKKTKNRKQTKRRSSTKKVKSFSKSISKKCICVNGHCECVVDKSKNITQKEINDAIYLLKKARKMKNKDKSDLNDRYIQKHLIKENFI